MPKLSMTADILVLFYAFTTIHAQDLFLPTDTMVTIADDTLESVTLDQSIIISGTTYSEIFISENGMVTTEDGFYGGASFPYSKPWIAPFGADIVPGAGTLSYRQFSSADTAQMNYATDLVKEVYSGDGFSASYAFAVSWNDVIVDNSGQVNSFQLILASDGTRLYAIFILKTVESLPVQIGASAGDGTAFYSVCYSDKRGHVQFFNRKSNAQCGGTNGVMVFRLDQSTWTEASYTCTHLNTPVDCRQPGPADDNFALRCQASQPVP